MSLIFHTNPSNSLFRLTYIPISIHNVDGGVGGHNYSFRDILLETIKTLLKTEKRKISPESIGSGVQGGGSDGGGGNCP